MRRCLLFAIILLGSVTALAGWYLIHANWPLANSINDLVNMETLIKGIALLVYGHFGLRFFGRKLNDL